MTDTFKFAPDGTLMIKTATSRKWATATVAQTADITKLLTGISPRPHPNEAWFAKRASMPQPDGKHATILLPLGTLLIGCSFIAAAGAPFLASALALASGLGCGWIQRHGRA